MIPGFVKIIIGVLVIALLGYGGYQAIRTLVRPQAAVQTPKPLNLVDYGSTPDTAVKLTLKGPVTAIEKHIERTLSLSSSERTLTVFTGYDDAPVHDETFVNNQAAFEDVIHALQNAGFTVPSKKATSASEVGACPSGTRAIYQLVSGGKTVYTAWSSTCGSGNFGGYSDNVRYIFENQFPALRQLPSQLRL